MKKVIMLLAITFISSIAFAQINLKIIQERNKLKKWAFCDYLSRSYKEYASLFISDGSAVGYFETGAYGISVYPKIDSLVIQQIKLNEKKYKSKRGRRLVLMAALDFYDSKILEETINKLDNEINLKRLKD